jgi:hypothetical protein
VWERCGNGVGTVWERCGTGVGTVGTGWERCGNRWMIRTMINE